jgi:hypothetical protein
MAKLAERAPFCAPVYPSAHTEHCAYTRRPATSCPLWLRPKAALSPGTLCAAPIPGCSRDGARPERSGRQAYCAGQMR